MLIINADNFEAEVTKSEQPVVLDLWGPKCGPCLALMPDVEALAEKYAGKIKFGKSTSWKTAGSSSPSR